MKRPKSAARGRSPKLTHPPLIISIHGIRTNGEWQDVFAAAMSGCSSKVEAFRYGYYGLARFLTPGLNSHLINKFYDWYGDRVKSCPTVDLDRYNARPSVVAHSLGSWILGNAMLKFADIRFDKVILAGSILPRDFDWGSLLARDQIGSLRNECGQKDPWPQWAGRFVSRAGTGGSEGFDWLSSAFANVRSDWFEHSDALMRTHIERYWIPFLFQTPSPLTLLHGRDIQDGAAFSTMLDHTGTVIDKQAFGMLTNYVSVEIARGLSLTWIGINPDIYTFLIDRDSGMPAGYINAMPVDDETYQRIRLGQIKDNEVKADFLVPYFGGAKHLKIYLMSIAIDEKYRRWGDGIFQQAYIQMITGFIDKLAYYAQHHKIRVTHFVATAWTDAGCRICKSFGMTQIGKDQFGDLIFELELESVENKVGAVSLTGLKRLLRIYRENKRSA